jgi:hypothetical protein
VPSFAHSYEQKIGWPDRISPCVAVKTQLAVTKILQRQRQDTTSRTPPARLAAFEDCASAPAPGAAETRLGGAAPTKVATLSLRDSARRADRPRCIGNVVRPEPHTAIFRTCRPIGARTYPRPRHRRHNQTSLTLRTPSGILAPASVLPRCRRRLAGLFARHWRR